MLRLDAASATERTGGRRPLAVSLVAAASVSLFGKIGDACAPLLLASGRPIALLLLNSNDAHSALTATDLGLVVWMVTIALRRLAEDGFYYYLGRINGLAASTALGFDLQDAGERWRRLSFAVLLLFPSAPVCIMLGTGGTSPLLFVLADMFSIIGRAMLIRGAIHSPLHAVIAAARSLCESHPAAAIATSAALATPGVVAACALGWRSLRVAPPEFSSAPCNTVLPQPQPSLMPPSPRPSPPAPPSPSHSKPLDAGQPSKQHAAAPPCVPPRSPPPSPPDSDQEAEFLNEASVSETSSENGSEASTDRSGGRRSRRGGLPPGPIVIDVKDPVYMKTPLYNGRALRPKGRDKWALIGRATGTTNELQDWSVQSRTLAMYARVHPHDREPGPLGSAWVPGDKRDDESWMATMRVASATLYSSWERCSRTCSDYDLAEHEKKCRAARLSLRHHPSVRDALDQYWTAILPLLPPPRTPGKPPTVDLKNYIRLQQRFHKALVGYTASGKGYDERVATRCARHDWELDVNPEEIEGRDDEQVMREKTFLDAVFAVVDTWTLGTTPAEYACFANELFERITDDVGTGYFLSTDFIAQIDLPVHSASYEVFHQAHEQRPAPQHRSIYYKKTSTYRARKDAAAVDAAAKEEAAARDAAKKAKWAAKLAEMKSEAIQQRSTLAAGMAAAGTAPTSAAEACETHLGPMPPPAARADGPSRPMRAPAGAQPVSHWQHAHAPSDAGKWYAKAQQWLQHGASQGGRACGRWDALPPSPRPAPWSAPSSPRRGTPRPGQFDSPQRHGASGMLTGALTKGGVATKSDAVAATRGDPPRPISSLSERILATRLSPSPLGPPPAAAAKGDSFFFTALTAAAALSPPGSPTDAPSPHPLSRSMTPIHAAIAAPTTPAAHTAKIPDSVPERDPHARPMTAPHPIRPYVDLDTKLRHPTAAYILQEAAGRARWEI